MRKLTAIPRVPALSMGDEVRGIRHFVRQWLIPFHRNLVFARLRFHACWCSVEKSLCRRLLLDGPRQNLCGFHLKQTIVKVMIR